MEVLPYFTILEGSRAAVDHHWSPIKCSYFNVEANSVFTFLRSSGGRGGAVIKRNREGSNFLNVIFLIGNYF